MLLSQLLILLTIVVPVYGFSAPNPTRRTAVEIISLAPLSTTLLTGLTVPEAKAAFVESETAKTTTTPISASWEAIDGLNTLEAGKFVSFDKGAYDAMVGDKSRTPQFETSIIKRLNSAIDGPGSQIVLDLGTGPYAYFAIVAAKAGAKKVYAIEASRDACKLARMAVTKAGYDNIITILEGYSTDITLPDNVKADFAIAEIVGSVASEEGVVATINDARLRLVKSPDDPASWIPRGVQTLGAPASYSLHNLFTPPAFDWTKLDGAPVRFNCRDEGLQLLSDPSVVEDIQFAEMGKSSGGATRSGSRKLTFTVDGKRVEENAKKFNDEYRRGHVPDAETLAMTAASSITGIALWPRLILDDDITINSRHYPDGDHQRSHWQTVLPIMSPVPVAVKGDDRITVDFEYEVPASVTTPPSYKITGSVVSV
jgi:hypothetical protein